MAAASLGRLTLDLVTKIGNFTGPMTQAERQAKNSSKNIANSFSVASVAATAFGAAVAGVSIGGMVAFADQTIQTGSEIKKFAQLANTSVRDFQFYAKGAETAGISMESFADKMKDMQDRIGDFQQTGGGPLADFFENIAPLVGVTIQQFQKLSGPEALQLYYDSLQKVGASQNDLKFYMEAIISDSSLLIPLLENGGEGFKKWGDAAERANAIMSDEMIETLALAKENVQLLSLQWDGLKATLVNNVVPVVQLVSDNMDDIKAVALALTAAMAVKLVPTVIATSIQLAQLAAFSVRAGAGLIGLSASASTTTGAMVALRGAMAFLGGPVGLAMLAAQGIAAGAAFAYMKSSSDSVKPSLDKQGKSVAELVVEYDNLTEAQQRAFKYQEAVELKDLTESYTKAQQQVRAYASSIAEVMAKDESTKNTIRGWIKEFDQNAISAETLANRINKLGTITEESKVHMDKHAVAATGAKSAMDAQQKVVDSLEVKSRTLARSTDVVTASVNNQAQAWLNLNQKQRAALTDINDEVLRSQYIQKNIAAGWSRERAEYVADYREQAGLGFSKRLSAIELKQLETGFKVQEQNKAREESEKKIEEAKRKQIELSQKQYSYSNLELKMLQKVAEINSKYGLNEIGSKYGIPENMLAAVMAQESKGNINAKSPTGAIGPFQTTSIFRKQYGLSVADSYDVKKSAEVAAKDLAESFKIFGNWNDAVTAYNAGVKGTKDLKSKGFTGSAAKTKEAREYAGKIDKHLVGLGGTSNKSAGFVANDATENLKDWGEYWNDIENVRKQSLERQKNVQSLYLSEEEQLLEANKEAIKEINLAYAGDDVAIKKYLALQQAAYEKDVAEYQEAQKQKELSDKKQLLEASRNWMTAGEYARQYYALVREEILNTSEYSPAMKQALIQGSLSQQNLEESYERDSAIEDYRDVMGYGENPLERQFEVLQKMRELDLLNEEAYQNAKLELQAKSTASYMEGMLGGFAALVDENSKTYAVLFAAQKAFAVAQAMLNIPAAYSKAYDAVVGTPYVGPYIAPAMGAAAAALQVAQAASMKSVNLTGMAHDGIDNIPKEGTWLLDGGERVLNPEQNKDLTRYLSEARESNTNRPIDNNLRVIMVKDENEAKDWLYGPDGEKAFLYHMKRNRSKV
ncbi:transglycosylase SLT domain-containing protein [Acinetobacter sp. UNC436CL71CviS28]|uniref:transglycosylase SLT domain-containing protein n=1 Tax=Acinetobacter sp. UNC436CL71CviS28 TaxID=1380368 RepID=UPI000686F0DD|nr:transglycosylase SLT domain-containing protein [Acinetobacter sp. UNC436CL71CviS28]